jgi:hypothetical protein
MKLVKEIFPNADNLPSYLSRVEKGRDKDFRSPLYGRDTPREVIVAEIEQFAYSKSVPAEMFDIERKEQGKIGPFSIMAPWTYRQPGVDKYFVDRKGDFDQSILNEAIVFIADYLKARKHLRPSNLDTVFAKSATNTNWGLPFFESGKTKGTEHYELARNFLLKGDFPYYPSILGWRGQPNGTKIPKQRVVWMYPHYVILLELLLQTSFLNGYKNHKSFVGWNEEPLIAKEVGRLLKLFGLKVSFDAGAFDANLIRPIIDGAFTVFGQCFQTEYLSLLYPIQEYFVTSGIVTPDGTYEGRSRAVPSGSGLTNLIDSLCQLIIAAYVCLRHKGKAGLKTFECTVLGDDGLWYWEGISPEKVTEFCNELRVEASLEKNFSSDTSCQFLQKYYSLEYVDSRGVPVGIRSVFRTVNGMLSYERLVRGWSEYMDSIRWIMQLEQLAGHPKHHEIVLWAMRGDKLQLGRVLKGGVKELAKRAGGAAHIAKTLRIESFPLRSRDPKGIMSFKTTRVIEQAK